MAIPSEAMIQAMLKIIAAEYSAARTKFRAMASAHEGYAVILEKMDELWGEIKANQPEKAKQEAIQVAAMALAFLLEVSD